MYCACTGCGDAGDPEPARAWRATDRADEQSLRGGWLHAATAHSRVNGPCVTAQYITAATGDGKPAVVADR